MGRPKEPIALVVAKGKKHLTQEEIETRQSQEVNAPCDNVQPPSFLTTQSQKNEFNQLAAELMSIGIMANLDCDLLGRYIVSKQMWIKTSKELSKLYKLDLTFHLEVIEKLSKLQDRYFKQCQNCARELGLTISSRCKLIAPTKNEESKPKNKFAKFQEDDDQIGVS